MPSFRADDAPGVAPLALATTAAHRLLAWPRYDAAADWEALAVGFGSVLRDRSDACLCLFHAAGQDSPAEAGLAMLERAFVTAFGPEAKLEVLLIDDAVGDDGWRALGRAVTGILALPSSETPARGERLAELGHRLITSPAELQADIDAHGPESAETASPRVTAIVSTYKSAVFMRGCLEDLVAQTLWARGELEILIIDSGSPENEGDIVREMQKRHPAIRYLRTERETLYAAWNRGVTLARGKYLTNANTDDRHRPDALELLARALDEQPQVGVVYADSLVTTRPNETFAQHSAEKSLNWPPFTYAQLQRQCIIGPQPMWRKSLHHRWGLFDDKFVVAGDYEFWLRIGRQERFARVPEVLGLYFQNGAGLEYASGRTAAETREVQARYAGDGPATPAPATVAKATPASRDPQVSVIMPTLDRPDFLARALQSLVAQTFTNFEVVVVNDAGKSLEPVLENFRGKLNITYVRHGANRDRAAARNTGLCIARGKYIAYLDDDDCYRPQHLATLVAALGDGSKVAYSDAIWVLEEKHGTGYKPVRPVLHRSVAFDPDRLLVANYIPILSVMHERACLDEVGGFDEELGTHEDWELWIRMAERWTFKHIAEVTADVSYRQDGSNTTSGSPSDFDRTMRLIHERYRRLSHDRPEIIERQKRAVAEMWKPDATAARVPAQAFAPVNVGPDPTDRARKVIAAARELKDRGDLKGASELLSASIDLATHSSEILLAIADVFVASRQIGAACEVLEQGSVMHPVDASLPLKLAEVLLGAGDVVRARQPAQKAASLGSAQAHFLLDSLSGVPGLGALQSSAGGASR